MENVDFENLISASCGLSSAVVAGHYCLNPDLEELSNEGEAEENSFRLGIELANKLIGGGVDVVLVLWVNDIGLNAGERQGLKESYVIPQNYMEIAEQNDFDPSEIEVMFESSMRNKASTALRKIYKKKPELFKIASSEDEDLVRCIDKELCEIDLAPKDAYVIDGLEGERLVVKEGPNPKCNLILATLFDVVAKRKDVKHIYNVFNSIYINRIRLGMHVNDKLYTTDVQYKNVFCDCFGGVLISDD